MASNEFVNVKDVVNQWISKMSDKTDNGRQGSPPDNTIDWSQLRTRSFPPTFADWETPGPMTVMLYNTSFRNDTETVQHHALICERQTKCLSHLTINSGLALREEIPLTFEVPESIREQSTGFKPELVVTKSQGQTFEEVLKWQIKDDIKVQPYHTAYAEAKIQENSRDCRFSLVQELRGQIHVKSHDPVTGTFLKRYQGDIVEMFRVFKGVGNMKDGQQYIYIRENKADPFVRIETKGRCNFRYGAQLDVKVEQELG